MAFYVDEPAEKKRQTNCVPFSINILRNLPFTQTHTLTRIKTVSLYTCGPVNFNFSKIQSNRFGRAEPCSAHFISLQEENRLIDRKYVEKIPNESESKGG